MGWRHTIVATADQCGSVLDQVRCNELFDPYTGDGTVAVVVVMDYQLFVPNTH